MSELHSRSHHMQSSRQPTAFGQAHTGIREHGELLVVVGHRFAVLSGDVAVGSVRQHSSPNQNVRTPLTSPEGSSFKPAPLRPWSNPLILPASNNRTKTGVVRLRQRKGPKREEKSPKWASGLTPVVRTSGREGPDSAAFRPVPRAGKRMSRMGDWRREAHSPQTFFSLRFASHAPRQARTHSLPLGLMHLRDGPGRGGGRIGGPQSSSD